MIPCLLQSDVQRNRIPKALHCVVYLSPPSSLPSSGVPIVSVEWLTESLLSGRALPLTDFHATAAAGATGATGVTGAAATAAGGGSSNVPTSSRTRPSTAGAGSTTAHCMSLSTLTSCRVGRRVYQVGEAVYVQRGKAVDVVILDEVQLVDGAHVFRGRLMKKTTKGVEGVVTPAGGTGPVMRRCCVARGRLLPCADVVSALTDTIVGKCVVLDAADWVDNCFGCDKEVWMFA
jgi:hypothetical protein